MQAGERLRADFTRAHMMPRTTSNWASPISSGRRGAGGERAAAFTETMLSARQRVHQALDAAGPEFGGLLLDVCCFLKGLDDIERERAWPSRSAKVVLQLALDRLARHYGYAAQVRGPAHAAIRTWLAEGESVQRRRRLARCRDALTAPKPRRRVQPPDCSFAHCSSSASTLPSSVEANPH